MIAFSSQTRADAMYAVFSQVYFFGKYSSALLAVVLVDVASINMLALASLAASAPLRKDAPLTEPDVLTEQELGGVLSQPEAPASLSATVAKSSCPSEVRGLLYNHIPKTGGTLVNHMLQAILSPGGEPKYQWDTRGSTPPGVLDASMPRYVYEMDQLKDANGNPMPISPGDGDKYFVIGLVRRPCDYLLSQWVEKSNEARKSAGKWGADWYGASPPYSSEPDKGRFRSFVGGIVNATNMAGQTNVRLQDAPFMSVGTRVRGYDAAKDGGYMHCMMYTHSLVNDFKSCIRQYQSCGRAPGFTPAACRTWARSGRRPGLPSHRSLGARRASLAPIVR